MRQLIGAANIEGGPFFHVMSGNLGYQVEHHLFPDMPSSRYGEIAPRVREICKRYGLPYNTGPTRQAVGHRAADDPPPRLPGRQAPPKPGPWTGETFINRGEQELQAAAEVQRKAEARRAAIPG